MGFFLEKVDQNTEQFIETEQETEKEPTMPVEKLNILHETAIVGKRFRGNQILVTRNIFGQNKVKVKGSGLRFRMPFIEEAYILDKGKYILEIKDPKNEDGRYSQDIGLGKDIKITLTVRVQASNNEKYVKKLLEQEKTYVYAIRYASERIMRAIIADQYQIKEELEELDIDQLKTKLQKTFQLDINKVIEGKEKISKECSKEILKITSDLLINFGIKLIDVHFPDVDLPKEITDMINKSWEAATQRTIDKANADVDVYKAEKAAEAEKTKRETEIEMLSKFKERLGLNEEQLIQYLKWGSLPPNAVAILGDEKGLTENFVAANMINKSQNSEGGKSK